MYGQYFNEKSSDEKLRELAFEYKYAISRLEKGKNLFEQGLHDEGRGLIFTAYKNYHFAVFCSEPSGKDYYKNVSHRSYFGCGYEDCSSSLEFSDGEYAHALKEWKAMGALERKIEQEYGKYFTGKTFYYTSIFSNPTYHCSKSELLDKHNVGDEYIQVARVDLPGIEPV